MEQNKNSNSELPFFARYLESQDYPSVQTDVKAGFPGGTQKYPTDIDEAHTMKYPSDGDDNLPTV